MKYQVYDLKNQNRGSRVEITLQGNAANVQLVDSINYSNYRSGRRYHYIGGLAKRSPVILQIPNTGHWFVVIDLNGLGGSVRSSVQVLPPPLPSIAERPLSSVPSLVRNSISREDYEGEHSVYLEYDVFISHASEDKDDLVRPLAHALQRKGLKIWYDEFEMRIGDSLRRKIDRGLATSRFGIVILSRAFISKGWTNYELDGIVTKATSGEQVILPIWHNITKKEVIDYSPSLADKLARNTAISTIDEISNEIYEVIASAQR